MGVYEYRGEPGMTYLYLKTVHGTAPHTLQPGDVVDFGENEPPQDRRWVEAADGATATRLPDNHPDSQPVVQWPEAEPEPQDAEPVEDAKPESDPAPADTAPAEPTKRSKPAAKTTA